MTRTWLCLLALLAACGGGSSRCDGEGAPAAVVLEVTALDPSSKMPVDSPIFSIDGVSGEAVCEQDAGTCGAWKLDLDLELSAGTHTLEVAAPGYAASDASFTAKRGGTSSEDPCPILVSVSPSSITVSLALAP